MVFPQRDKSLHKESDYVLFRNYLERACGIMLGDNKNYLVDSRLRKIIKDNNFQSLSELVEEIDRPGSSRFRQQVIDAMTTNETLWFRDGHPFDYLKNELFPSMASRPGDLSIWCAACSTGQEPYSISICAEEAKKRDLAFARKSVNIVATDISSGVLEQAKAGIYETLALKRGMSEQRLKQYFKETGNNSWEIDCQIKKNIVFRPINLKDNFTNIGSFDIVFCRNVLIYFSTELQMQIIRNIHQVLKTGGALFLGGSETPKGLIDLFETHFYRPGVVYIKK